MAHHHIGRQSVVYRFAPDIAPVLQIDPGDTVTFETLDSWSGRLKRPEDIGTVPMDPAHANPATGPVYVRGAMPGDALAVIIETIRLIPPGLAKIVPSGGILGGEVKAPVLHFVDVVLGPAGDEVVFPAAFGNLRLPAKPMIGVIGTAPADESVMTLHPGDHGGNLDVNLMHPGATAYFPVNVPGGLVALGDCHATMGDGELSGAGIDICTETTVRIDLVKGLRVARPRIETNEVWATVGQAASLQAAVQIATRDMVDWLAERLTIGREEALILISAGGDARIGQSAGIGVNAIAYVVFPKAGDNRRRF